MTYYVMTDGQAETHTVLNTNQDQIVYAVLENRLAHDKHGLTQLNPYIQSDIFTDADGCYNTIRTVSTTSVHNSTYCYYINANSTFSCPANYFCCYVHGTYISVVLTNNCINFCGTCTTSANYCAYVCLIPCATYLCLNNYNKICIVNCACYYVPSGGLICACSNFSGIDFYNIYNTTFNADATTSYTITYNGEGNNFDIYCNSICVGVVAKSCCLMFGNFMCYQGCGSCTIINKNYLYMCIFTFTNVSCSSIYTNIKNYSTPKNSVILITDSTLPTGNYIRYNIKNQAGTVLLCNGCPDSVQQLTAATSCCFYAEIYQCACCCTCAPQCMRQYALMFM